jgi:hypothetical protein
VRRPSRKMESPGAGTIARGLAGRGLPYYRPMYAFDLGDAQEKAPGHSLPRGYPGRVYLSYIGRYSRHNQENSPITLCVLFSEIEAAKGTRPGRFPRPAASPAHERAAAALHVSSCATTAILELQIRAYPTERRVSKHFCPRMEQSRRGRGFHPTLLPNLRTFRRHFPCLPTPAARKSTRF